MISDIMFACWRQNRSSATVLEPLSPRLSTINERRTNDGSVRHSEQPSRRLSDIRTGGPALPLDRSTSPPRLR
ncbi:hypothetical protein C9J85_18210 [Haloferax sp. wsp5]|nr:hypothetical protein C9J85_18210 [Haloferax sp. wsp5]